jgi:hydroxyacylglutathione hydrolase
MLPLQIHRLCARTDNYIFVLEDRTNHEAIVIDPTESAPVLDWLARKNATLTAIWNTHHHPDHIGGNRELLARFPGLTICGGANDRGRIPGQTVFLEESDRLEFAGRSVQVMFIPGHTRGHIAYYFEPESGQSGGQSGGHLFSGDTIFGGGCGRLFEGTPAQMVETLGRLRTLPRETQIWCSHEYTLANLRFASTVDPDNLELQRRLEKTIVLRDRHEATIPTTMDLELRTNPFLRWDEPALQAAVASQDSAETFGRLRGRKESFKS